MFICWYSHIYNAESRKLFYYEDWIHSTVPPQSILLTSANSVFVLNYQLLQSGNRRILITGFSSSGLQRKVWREDLTLWLEWHCGRQRDVMQVLDLRDTLRQKYVHSSHHVRWDRRQNGNKNLLTIVSIIRNYFLQNNIAKQGAVSVNTKTAFFDREWRRGRRERQYRKYLTAASIIVVSLGDLWPRAAIHSYRLSLTDYPNYSYFPTISHGPGHYILPGANSLLTEKSFDLLDVPSV